MRKALFVPCVTIVLNACTIIAVMAQGEGLPEGTIQKPVDAHQWADAPHLSPGVRILVLEGDPKAEGMFTIRLRIPAGRASSRIGIRAMSASPSSADWPKWASAMHGMNRG